MVWYIVVFLLCVLGFILNNYVIKNEKYKIIIDIGLILILIFVSGTRYNLGGYDYHVYKKVFDAVPLLGDFNISTIHNINDVYNMEKGFLLLCSIVKSVGFTYYGFTLICSIIFYLCMYFGLRKYTKNFTFLLIIFMYKLFIYQTFVFTRQMLCIGIFFILFRYFINGKFLKYFIGCVFMSFFHMTSLILIPVYFVRYLNINKKFLIRIMFFFAPLTLISLFKIPFFETIFSFIGNIIGGGIGVKIIGYANLLKNGSTINLLNTLEYFILMAVIIYKYDELVSKNKNCKFIIQLILILLPLFTIFRGYEVLARLKDYFVIFYAILIEYIVNCEKVKKFDLQKYCYACVALFCFAGYVRYLITFDDGDLLPYNSYINDNVNIFHIEGEIVDEKYNNYYANI